MATEEASKPTGFQDDVLQLYPDDEIIQFVDASPRSTYNCLRGVRFLSDNLVAKWYRDDEFDDMIRAEEVAVGLGVRVPGTKRVVKYQKGVWCIMDRVHGATLEEAWPDLGWIQTFRLALQLRRWIWSLRSVTSNVVGSLATGKCRSFWLEDRFGLPPRASPQDIVTFLSFWTRFVHIRNEAQASQNAKAGIVEVPPPQDRQVPVSEPLVLTHHDLAPRNMMLDTSGSLWLIDWDRSGFYPAYFEYPAMYNFREYHKWSFFSRIRWHLFTGIAAGRYFRERKMLERIRGKFTRFSAGRRFELLRNGGPTSKRVT
ncbi:hypothetical protein DV738_g1272, partial [Chaetothyriales sp. CBS 135597]